MVALKFKGKLLTVVTDEIELPNGDKINLEIVKHPGAVLVIPLLSSDKLIILREYRPVIESYIYELPAGTLKENENPAVCARRELVEEIGYYPKRLRRLGVIYSAPGYSTEKIIIYVGEELVKKGRRLQEDEIIDSTIISTEEVFKLLRKGKIIDAKTISALAMYYFTIKLR